MLPVMIGPIDLARQLKEAENPLVAAKIPGDGVVLVILKISPVFIAVRILDYITAYEQSRIKGITPLTRLQSYCIQARREKFWSKDPIARRKYQAEKPIGLQKESTSTDMETGARLCGSSAARRIWQ